MPKQLNSSYQEETITFAKMSYTPDVPASALTPNEYNSGSNVETDVRGIRSVAGDQYILPALPEGVGAPTFVTGGFRGNGLFYFIVALQAVDSTPGAWYASDGGAWVDITPLHGDFMAYAQNTNITETWNGTVPFFNDEHNPPMFWPEPTIDQPSPVMIMYSNQIPIDITAITAVTPTVKRLDFVAQARVPFAAGDYVILNNINPRYYDGGPFLVITGDVDHITYASTVTEPYYSGGSISPAYAWNYNPNWLSVYARFMRMFNTPNVGSILVAGDLTATVRASFTGLTTITSDVILTTSAQASWLDALVSSSVFAAGTTVIAVTPNVSIQVSTPALSSNTAIPIDLGLAQTESYPVSVRWSQQFGLNTAPYTWEPTVINIANELEVPLRGPAIDAFPSNGSLYLCSYWDTVVFSPLNYSTTSTPILGVRMFNQGRGMLSSNCWANTDKYVYGIDARDIWVFDGQNFQGLGNQRVKQWFFDELSPLYYDRVFMDVNTQRNQIEIYYPDSHADNGVPNKVLSYRYDLDCWNSPRDVINATFSCESPIWQPEDRTYSNQATTTGASPLRLDVSVVYASEATPATYTYAATIAVTDTSTLGATYTVLGTQLGGLSPANDMSVTVTAIDGANQITGISATGTPAVTWRYAAGSRTIVYAQGIGTATQLLQKDQGYAFGSGIDQLGTEIASYFRRDNIKVTRDYSNKIMVHRILPEVVNLGAIPFTGRDDRPIDPAGPTTHLGSVTLTLEGAGSVGAVPTSKPAVTMATTTDNPWCQFDQNAYRVNNFQIGNTSNLSIWMCNATTWQFTVVEDDR